MVYVCEFTLPPKDNYVIEMLNESGDWTESINGANLLSIFQKPSIEKIRVPALPIA
jgi:hypothetical protein